MRDFIAWFVTSLAYAHPKMLHEGTYQIDAPALYTLIFLLPCYCYSLINLRG